MRVLALAALGLLLPTTVAGQRFAPAGGFAVELAALRHGQSDAAASPLRYQGTFPAMVLRYAHVGAVKRFEVTAAFGSGGLESRITAGGFPSEAAHTGRLGVRFLRTVGTAYDGHVSLMAGAQLDAHAAVRIHSYRENHTEVFADALVPLQAAAGWDWVSGGTRAGQRLATPILGLVMRTPWGGLKVVPPLRPAWPGELTGLDHEVFVERAASARVDLRLAWAATLLRHREPRELRLVTHRVALGMVLHRSRQP